MDPIMLIILLVIPLAILQFCLGAALIVSVARKELPWSEKWPWLLLFFVNIIGPIIYFVVGSNKLDERAANYLDEQERGY